MAVQLMGTTEYAKLRKIGNSAVVNALTRGHRLPGVKKWERIGRPYVLHVNIAEVKDFVKKSN